MNIIEAIHDREIFGSFFKDLSTWKVWEVVLKATFALPMTDEELILFRTYTGRKYAPMKLLKEIWLLIGRRGGKSFMVSIIAVFLAIFKNYAAYLSPGEPGVILIIAVDRRQAQIILRYVKAILSLPMFRAYVKNEKVESIELTNGIIIEVQTPSYRSARGWTIVAIIFEESSFWRVEGANPDKEIYRAVKPALATIPDALLISISTAYGRQGLNYENFKEYYGKDDDEVLFWKAPSLVMNPTLPSRMIDKEREKDPSAARSEWDSEFREDIEGFLPLEVIERVVIPQRIELPFLDRLSPYKGFFDAAGGGADFFAFSIGHKEGDKAIQDLLQARKGSPYVIVKDFSDLLEKYGIRELTGDKYAGSWVETAFQKEGITYRAAEKNKSEIYLEALPYISGGLVELLDAPQLVKELRLLERRRGPSGKDVIDHPKSQGGGIPHDDLANVTCGMITELTASKKTAPGHVSLGLFEGEDIPQHQEKPRPALPLEFKWVEE